MLRREANATLPLVLSILVKLRAQRYRIPAGAICNRYPSIRTPTIMPHSDYLASSLEES